MSKKLFWAALLLALSIASLQAQSVPYGSQIQGVSGNGRSLVTTTGPQTSGNLVKIDANGNHVDSGSASSGGNGTVTTISAPASIFSVANPTSTPALSYATGQTANRVFATDASGNVGSFALTTAMLPSIASTFLSDSSSLVRTTDTATVTNTMLAGSIANAKLLNSSFTVAGHAVSLGGTQTVACGDLSNAAASCSTDATNASNIGSGTLAPARGGVASSFSAGPDWPPTSANAMDDEFTVGSLGGIWTWANQGSATTTFAGGHLQLSSPTNGSAQTLHIIEQTLPSAPYEFTAKVALYATSASSFFLGGLVLHESGTGKCVAIELQSSGANTWKIQVQAYSALSSATATPRFAGTPSTMGAGFSMSVYLKVGRSGSNVYFSISNPEDGSYFVQELSEAMTTDFTTAPDRVGFYVNPFSVTGTLVSDWFRRTI